MYVHTVQCNENTHLVRQARPVLLLGGEAQEGAVQLLGGEASPLLLLGWEEER